MGFGPCWFESSYAHGAVLHTPLGRPSGTAQTSPEVSVRECGDSPPSSESDKIQLRLGARWNPSSAVRPASPMEEALDLGSKGSRFESEVGYRSSHGIVSPEASRKEL